MSTPGWHFMPRGRIVADYRVTGYALAPAKVNLGLAITGKRPDGYHDLTTIMQTVSLFDRVRMLASGTGNVVTIGAAIDSGENLISRAARLMAEVFGKPMSVDFHVHKRIPLSSGLGGGSSDAAAAIRLLAASWQIAASDPRLNEVALACGSDVPFFLSGGRALVEGRGEQVRVLAPLLPCWLVVAVPETVIPSKTRTLYSLLRPDDFGGGDWLHAAASSGMAPAGHLPNTFERPTSGLAPEVQKLRSIAGRLHVLAHGLSGAGPAYFMCVDDVHAVLRLAWDLRSTEALRGHTIRVARTMNGPGPMSLRGNP
jgi:4-diphosphocytidyl-2-C-methyl-D-erythritol kinase